MTKRPRTPPHWPHMKVRGARNRAKTAQRLTTQTILLASPLFNHDGSVTFFVSPTGSYRLVVKQTRDGWGRSVKNP